MGHHGPIPSPSSANAIWRLLPRWFEGLDNQEPPGLHEVATLLDRTGFRARPSWSQIQEGTRPPQNSARDLGEWPHGWQYWASSTLDTSFRKMFMLFGRPASCQAHLQVTTLGWRCHMFQQLRSSPFLHIFSVCWFWRGCGCLCL